MSEKRACSAEEAQFVDDGFVLEEFDEAASAREVLGPKNRAR